MSSTIVLSKVVDSKFVFKFVTYLLPCTYIKMQTDIVNENNIISFNTYHNMHFALTCQSKANHVTHLNVQQNVLQVGEVSNWVIFLC